jgi:hypothetical protein
VYKVNPVTQSGNNEAKLDFEDENCIVSYNFWKDGGNIGFLFTNKTGENLYLDMTESFFILNGIANDYYKERTFSSATSRAKSTSRSFQNRHGSQSDRTNIYATAHANTYADTYSASARASVNGTSNWLEFLNDNTTVKASSESSSVSVNERKVICIPPKASKVIMEYDITNTVYRDCNLLRYPRKNDKRSIRFAKTDSPLQFSNLLAYYVGGSDELVKIENAFYVSEISNYERKHITEERIEKNCGKIRANSRVRVFKDASPDKFYISYQTDFDRDKY